jgi:ribosomal protein L30/L7E
MKKAKLILKRSLIGSTKKQKLCIQGLGIKKKINAESIIQLTPENMGMIRLIRHLITICEHD